MIADNYVVKKGEKLELHLFVADRFNIEWERPLQKAITKRFELINENGHIDLESRYNDGAIPILDIDVNFSALGLIHMVRDYARISLAKDKFKAYLKEDNIENITITEG